MTDAVAAAITAIATATAAAATVVVAPWCSARCSCCTFIFASEQRIAELIYNQTISAPGSEADSS